MTPGRVRARAAAGAVVLILLNGCASARPTPVTSIGPLVGKWSGTVETDRGYQQFFYLTINADQTLVASWGVYWSWGRVIVSSGQATYQMTPPPSRAPCGSIRAMASPRSTWMTCGPPSTRLSPRSRSSAGEVGR